jgi:BASS family bile acid:Na+ symporter
METAEALMGMLFNAALVIMIVATMFSAGLSTTLSALGGVFKNVWLVVLVLIAAFLIRPLVGWGTAALLALATPAFIAMLLLAACPGAPFGAKLVMTARGDLITGATLQVLMAAIGSVTFPITANWLISAAGLGGDFSLPVWDLVKTVAVLQLVPFVVGIGVRHWSPETAARWNPHPSPKPQPMRSSLFWPWRCWVVGKRWLPSSAPGLSWPASSLPCS